MQHYVVQVYTGVNKLGYIQPQTLARQDIVITSYETLRKEIDYVDLPHTNSQLLLQCASAAMFVILVLHMSHALTGQNCL